MLYFVFGNVRLIGIYGTRNYLKVILVILSLLLLKNNRVYKYIRIYIKRSITITIYCEVVTMHKSGEFLKGIRRAELLIKRKREQLERLEHLAVYSGVRNDEIGGGRGTKTIMDTKAEIVCRIIEVKEEIERDVDKLIDLKVKAMRMIDNLDNGDMVDILYRRYFEFRKWEDIAHGKHRSMDWVFRLHREALKKIDKMLISN